VCTGNVCRSPIAEALLRHALEARGRADISVRSAGTAAADGTPASEGSYLIGLEAGVDLSPHRARLLTREAVAEADLILGMSAHHVERAVALGGSGKAFLLGAYVGREGIEAEVEDPFGADLETYRQTWAQIADLVDEAVERLLADGGDGRR
jgi:protein-tyrosine phosphatase